MDASGHLRTVSALLDLDEFEMVDLQQDRRAKHNVIGVIPKTTTGRPATPARLYRRPSLPFGLAPTWPCPSRMRPRAGPPPGLPNGTQRAFGSCDHRRRVIPDAGRLHRECRSLALPVPMGRSLAQCPNPKRERGVLARSDGTIAGPMSEPQARARGLGPSLALRVRITPPAAGRSPPHRPKASAPPSPPCPTRIASECTARQPSCSSDQTDTDHTRRRRRRRHSYTSRRCPIR